MRPLTLAALIALVACDKPAEPTPAPNPADIEKARTEAVQVQQLAEQYQLQKRACPTSVAELVAADFVKSAPVDPWGGDYTIVCEEGGGIEVRSVGPDKVAGNADDISSDDSL